MSAERELVIEKIKKLLRMKRGGTPAEVETALAMAAELARKHGIDLNRVNPDEVPDQPIGHIDALTSSRLQWECKYAALVCENFFNVTAMCTQDRQSSFRGWGGSVRGKSVFRIKLIGTSWDTQIALYVYHFLVRQFRVCWATKRGRARNRHAFMHGMFKGICSKLLEQKRQQVSEAGLVLIGKAVARRKEYLDRHWPNHESEDTAPDTDAVAASLAGFYAGRETEIRSGVTAGGRVAPMLADGMGI
ncbi:MAG TPA: DUF2786 domain-containing protein [Clostridia bacterium]|nr:DUF2786 domain-containing protein [Clostridia bacterium]